MLKRTFITAQHIYTYSYSYRQKRTTVLLYVYIYINIKVGTIRICRLKYTTVLLFHDRYHDGHGIYKQKLRICLRLTIVIIRLFYANILFVKKFTRSRRFHSIIYKRAIFFFFFYHFLVLFYYYYYYCTVFNTDRL